MKCETITVDEAAMRLGISRNSAYSAAQRGDLPAVKIGRRIVIPRRAFEELLSKTKIAAESADNG